MSRPPKHRILRRCVDVTLAIMTLVVLAALVAAWPTRLGGSSSFVFVAGISMEPTFNREDLVIARHSSGIHIGDVIVYRIPDGAAKGKLIVHRVVSGDGTHGFTTKGDNNPSVDPFHPTAGAVLGKVWLHVGHGHLLRRGLRLVLTPWAWAVFGTVVAFVVTWRIATTGSEETSADADLSGSNSVSGERKP
jgi:signal peptidase I